MSIVFTHPYGWIVSHEEYLENVYRRSHTSDGIQDFNFKEYFRIFRQFSRGKEENLNKSSSKKRKRENLSETTELLKERFTAILNAASQVGAINFLSEEVEDPPSNDIPRSLSCSYFEGMSSLAVLRGGNLNDYPVVSEINRRSYLFPPNSLFHNDDITSLGEHIGTCAFDFILLDPPWNNRFVKRRKKFHPEHGYKFLNQEDLKRIPVGKILRPNGLVAVWTTNSTAHLDSVENVLFPAWGLKRVSMWFWIKVTKTGKLIVPFSKDDQKQPYERLVFGSTGERSSADPEDLKCFISVPSAIHSHKPPLAELLKSYLPERSSSLELFARYLLPNFTSYGNQVLSLQLLSLYRS